MAACSAWATTVFDRRNRRTPGQRFADAPDAIVRVCYGERDGNPVVFPKVLFDELASLQPGQTGSAVIRRHAGCLVRCQAEHARELWDVDTREDYRALEARGEG